MGIDSAGTNGLEVTIRADKDVFINGDFIFGFAGSFRMAQLLRYKFNPPAFDGKDLFRYMAVDFIDSAKSLFRDNGWAFNDSCFLVGGYGRVFKIQSDYQVAESVDNCFAAGSGMYYALGSLYSTPHLSPKKRLEKALACSAYYNAAVCGPFHILKLPRRK
jgi:ATP-dependent protease HslVU (ClpYQ) peptidase subunit